jgi:hypothetical protein
VHSSDKAVLPLKGLFLACLPTPHSQNNHEQFLFGGCTISKKSFIHRLKEHFVARDIRRELEGELSEIELGPLLAIRHRGSVASWTTYHGSFTAVSAESGGKVEVDFVYYSGGGGIELAVDKPERPPRKITQPNIR